MEKEEKTPEAWWQKIPRLGSLTQRPAPPEHLPETARPLPAHLQSGQAAEDAAVALLQAAGLRIVQRNYKTPGRGGGEIDIIARDGATLVFIEVRQRKTAAYGGAAASISAAKQRHWRYAAQCYLQRFGSRPPDCRFDVVLFEGQAPPQWLRGVL